MKYNEANVLKLTTNNEGGYSNHPKDPGGPTNHGITIGTLRAWRGGQTVTIADVQRLTLAQANEIYEHNYWRPIWGDQLPAGLDYATCDFGVNSGVSRAVKELQGLLPGVAIDGLMGMKTINAIKAFDVEELIKGLCNARMKFLKKLRTWKTFGRGWTYRVTGVDPNRQYRKRPGVVGDALAMVAQRPVSLLPFPIDDLLPLAKGRDIDQNIFAPLGNKIQAGIGATITGGTVMASLPGTLSNLLPGLQQAQSSLETIKDVSKVLTFAFVAVSLALVVLTILHTAQKAREPGLDT